jgi:hypothetical protein
VPDVFKHGNSFTNIHLTFVAVVPIGKAEGKIVGPRPPKFRDIAVQLIEMTALPVVINGFIDGCG